MTQEQILDKCHIEHVSKSGLASIHPSKFPVAWRYQAVTAMWEFGVQFAYDFAKFLEDHTEMIREEKITLYRYCDSNNEWGNYTLEDILTEFKEKYEG
jgi:hypothetical protein